MGGEKEEGVKQVPGRMENPSILSRITLYPYRDKLLLLFVDLLRHRVKNLQLRQGEALCVGPLREVDRFLTQLCSVGRTGVVARGGA